MSAMEQSTQALLSRFTGSEDHSRAEYKIGWPAKLGLTPAGKQLTDAKRWMKRECTEKKSITHRHLRRPPSGERR